MAGRSRSVERKNSRNTWKHRDHSTSPSLSLHQSSDWSRSKNTYDNRACFHPCHQKETPHHNQTEKAKVQIGKVVSIAYKEGTNTIIGVTVRTFFLYRLEVLLIRASSYQLSNGEVIAADAVIIAMGPWSGHIQLVPGWQHRRYHCVLHPLSLFLGDKRGLPVSGSRAHSIVLQPSKPVTPHAIFLDYKTASGMTSDPEIYPRPDGQVYVCGMTDDELLPANPADASPGEETIK